MGAAALGMADGLLLRALEPATPLANLSRQSWAIENGLPQNTVQALAQTTDGFVWLGTEVGLVRFDGNGFLLFDQNSKPALPGNDVRCLLATDDGTLWVGTADGLARIQGGTVRVFTVRDGLPGNAIQNLSAGAAGRVWASTASESIELDRDSVRLESRSAGSRAPGEATALSVQLSDGGWARANATTLTIGRSGRKDAQLSAGRELQGTRIQRLFADRRGALWIGTNAGLARYANGKLEFLPLTDPLAHSSILALMEDREGDLWVGTETDGLHILRDQRFHVTGSREGMSTDAASTVVEDTAGKLWVGTNGGGLNVIREDAPGGMARIYAVHDALLSDVILSLAVAPNGDLWVGTPDGLNRLRGGAVDAFTSADGLPDDFIRSLLADADGSLWIGTRRGLAHWTFAKDGRGVVKRTAYTQSSGLGSDLVGAMERDAHGDLWVATFAGLSRIANGRIMNYTTADGLSSNVVTAILPRADGTLLVGTQDRGWDAWDGQRFAQVSAGGSEQASIHAILEDGGHHLWFATGDGIARCDWSGEAKQGCANWLTFGPADGLRGRETATNSHPSAWRSRDGRLWFATPKGLVEIDPATFQVNTVAPPVAIERFAVDDVDAALLQASGPRPSVAAGHSHFQFDYAGLSFVAPQKVRYRYMLQGFDHAWTEAGGRRTAYYTNIPPGHFTFRVQAANNDGLWNTTGASLEFDLEPHFYQTFWFYALAVLAAAATVFLILRRRLVRAEREFNAVLGERNRIAREIHDTLAQGYVGISVQLEVLAELLRLKKVEAAEKQLDTTRGFVREGLADARQSIWALRSQDSGENTLPVKMRRLVESAAGEGYEARFNLFGAYRPMSAEAEQEFLRVAQEAIHNVNKHAAARRLTVRLEYLSNEIALEVEDDGRGFDASRAQDSPPGHFGLTGMLERAAAIGGTLEVTSVPGAGTTVRLTTPVPRELKESN